MMRALPPLLLSVAAFACVQEDARLPHEKHVMAADHRRAPAIMRHYGCTSCHTIPGVPGADSQVGPSLSGFAERRYIAGRVPNEPDWLLRWIQHPQGVKPGTAMPDMGVTAEHARSIAAYLYRMR